MSITLHTTSYGTDATGLLVDRVAQVKAASPLTPVTVVVPSNFVGISARRTLAKAQPGGVIGLSILTIYRVAELLGAGTLAGQGRRPISTPVVGAAVRRVLAADPGIFHRVHDHPATEASLARTHRELSDLTPDALDRLAATSGRASDVVRIHRATREVLAGEWYDEADLMAAATSTSATSTVLDDIGTVVLHLPQRLSHAAAALILAMAARTEVQVIAALTGHPAADAEVVRCLDRLGLTAPTVEPAAPTVSKIVTVSDADEEARTAVAEVIAAARNGIALERMAILYPSAEPYARIVSDHLDAADIDWNGRAVRPLSDRLTGRWLLDLLALANSRWARPAVLGMFTAAPMRRVKGHADKVAAWERLSREAGIVDGREQWDARLTRLAANRRAQAAALPEDDDWRAQRLEAEAQTAEDLRDVVAGLEADLANGAEATTWAALAKWAKWMIETHLGNEKERGQWPPLEQAAAQKVEDALDRLGSLDQIESATDLDTFTRSLELELEDDLGRKGRFGEGVMVGTLAAGLGIDVDLVVVLGMAEGVLPTRPREDSLLADADRQVVADQLPLRSTRVGQEHRQYLAALAASAGERVLVFPRGDLRRSVERAPSRWLRDAVEAATGQRDLDVPMVTHVPSYAGRIAASTFANDDQERRLGDVRRLLGTEPLTPAVAADLDPVLAHGVDLLDGRGRTEFTRFNGNLGEVAADVAALHDAPAQLSASRVESFLSCPHGFLIGNVLRVRQVDNPEEQLTISPMDRGTLVHDVLERWLAEQLAAGTVPTSSTPWPDLARLRLRILAEEALDDIAAQGVVGHPVLWRQERRVLLSEFGEFLRRDDDLRHRRGLTPIAVEAPFGFEGRPQLTVDLGDGRSMRFGGMIDRLDRANNGAIVVTDYKTGSTRNFKGLSQDDPDAGGAKVQLMLYALAARQILGEPDAPVHAQYWFTSSKGGWEEIGYDVTAEVEERLVHVLLTVDDQIRAGRFPQRPEEPGWKLFVSCHHCDPDGLGTAARHREFERLVKAPELRDYLTLVAPGLLEVES